MKRSLHLSAALAALALVCGAARGDAAAEPLTLAQAVRLAAAQNPGVVVATTRIDAAQAKIGQARAAFLPTVTGEISAVDRTYNFYAMGFTLPAAFGAFPALIGPVYDNEARLKVSQPLFDFAGWRRLQASQLGRLGARADLGVASEAASSAAALAYLRAARAEAVTSARAEDLSLAEQLAGLADAQVAAGTSPNIDATRARTQVAAARGALLIARNQRDRALIDLARALGVDPATPLRLADTLAAGLGASDAPPADTAAVAFALEHRDELRADDARLARARTDRTATRSERLPRLDGMLDWGSSGPTFGGSIGTRTWAVALTVPLLDGFRREGRLAEQAASIRETEVRAKDTRDQVASEVGAATLDLANGREQQAIAAERLQLAREEIAQATERFTNGVAGNIELINAQSSLVRARDADIDARFAVASARIALARATGVARSIH